MHEKSVTKVFALNKNTSHNSIGRVVWKAIGWMMLAVPTLLQNEDSIATQRREPQFSAETYRFVQSKACAGCHGSKGQGRYSITAPPLAGQSAETLKKKIKAYRDGERHNPAMRLVTQHLTDEEIARLADYYSSFSVPNSSKKK